MRHLLIAFLLALYTTNVSANQDVTAECSYTNVNQKINEVTILYLAKTNSAAVMLTSVDGKKPDKPLTMGKGQILDDTLVVINQKGNYFVEAITINLTSGDYGRFSILGEETVTGSLLGSCEFK